jgi:hypothetical protein
MNKKPTVYNSFKNLKDFKAKFEPESTPKLVPLKQKKTENKKPKKNVKPHWLDPVFAELNKNELFRKRYFEYLQMANNAFGTVFYAFAEKRKSTKVQTITLDNNNKITVNYTNKNNELVKSTRDVNTYLLLYLYEQKLKQQDYPYEKKKQLKKVKEFGAQLKYKSLDFFIKENLYVLRDLPEPQKQEFLLLYNETFFTEYPYRKENDNSNVDGIWQITSAIDLLKEKRHYLEHYPKNEPITNEFGVLIKLFNLLQPKQAQEFSQIIISLARKAEIAESDLIDLIADLDAVAKKLKKQKNGQKLFLNSDKFKNERERLVQKAKTIKENTKLTEEDRKKQLSQLHAIYIVNKTKRQALHLKFEKLKKVKEELFEPYQDKKRDKKLLELMNYIGMPNFLKIRELFTSKGLEPGFNDINDLYECANRINTIIGNYLSKLQDKLPVTRKDNFALRLLDWCKRNNKNRYQYNELMYLRNEIKHNTNCFMIEKQKEKNTYYKLHEIILQLDNAYKTIVGITIYKELVNLILPVCKQYNYSMVYDKEAKKPIKKITIWTKEYLALYGKEARAKNENLVVDNRKVLNNLLLENIKLMK